MEEITTEEQLRALLGDPVPAALAKERSALTDLDRAWLAASPFCLIATSGADGSCDVSPKGDPPGFTLVLDDRTVAVPERAGNRRADGYRNILANPHVGLIHLLPGRTDTLRINGRARLVPAFAHADSPAVSYHRSAWTRHGCRRPWWWVPTTIRFSSGPSVASSNVRRSNPRPCRRRPRTDGWRSSRPETRARWWCGGSATDMSCACRGIIRSPATKSTSPKPSAPCSQRASTPS